MRDILEGLPMDRVYLQGVRVVTVRGAGHNVMFDHPYAFVAAVAGQD